MHNRGKVKVYLGGNKTRAVRFKDLSLRLVLESDIVSLTDFVLQYDGSRFEYILLLS